MIGITFRGVQRCIEPRRGFATSATALDSAMMGRGTKKGARQGMAGPMGVGNMAQRPVFAAYAVGCVLRLGALRGKNFSSLFDAE